MNLNVIKLCKQKLVFLRCVINFFLSLSIFISLLQISHFDRRWIQCMRFKCTIPSVYSITSGSGTNDTTRIISCFPLEFQIVPTAREDRRGRCTVQTVYFVVDRGVAEHSKKRGVLPPATDNRPWPGPESLRPGQANEKSCKKGLRNSRTKVPTPEAGALLSGLITLPTSTRGICVRVYTLRREHREEKRGERDRQKRAQRLARRKEGERGAIRDVAGRKPCRLACAPSGRGTHT